VRYIAERGLRLARGIGNGEPLPIPVGAVLIGRRNNPPEREAGIRPLAVYNPIHYQELPEFFMDVICSLTGKSPSTTGAGSEGALTKGPFNALRTIIDLNAALVSYILTGLGGFSTAAGYVGPDKRVDHDISLLVPEIWCRMNAKERDPEFLIGEGHLEIVQDFDHGGRRILASRLGYRITPKFVRTFFGRMFDHPDRVFDEAYLRPETQDIEAFVDGVNNITEAQERVALQAFSDGSIEEACPPLKALLSIMAHGSYEGMDAPHPAIRALFTRQAVETSDWYQERLAAKQRVDERLWRRHVAALDAWLAENARAENDLIERIRSRRELASRELEKARSAGYLKSLQGTLGVQPSLSH
jgi:phosphoenolpyruvate carboxykinase (diphosphate)